MDENITGLLESARQGDRVAIGALVSALYPELRRIAHARLARQRGDQTLSTTVLVHEFYLKLLRAERLGPSERVHFLAYAASAMRSLTVDAARARSRERRGGNAEHVPLATDFGDGAPLAEEQMLQIDQALNELAKVDPRLARIVEMRYFVGLNDPEIAEALGITDRTVRREWQKARLLLAVALDP